MLKQLFAKECVCHFHSKDFTSVFVSALCRAALMFPSWEWCMRINYSRLKFHHCVSSGKRTLFLGNYSLRKLRVSSFWKNFFPKDMWDILLSDFQWRQLSIQDPDTHLPPDEQNHSNAINWSDSRCNRFLQSLNCCNLSLQRSKTVLWSLKSLV